jgi:hypothetical protein
VKNTDYRQPLIIKGKIRMPSPDHDRTGANMDRTESKSDAPLTRGCSPVVRDLDGKMRRATGLERIRLEKLKEHLENGSPAKDINRLLKEAV